MSFIQNGAGRGASWARRVRCHPLLTAGLLLLLSGSASAQSLFPPPEQWCDFGRAGPAATQPAPVAMSAAHGQVRFFGVGPSYTDADLSLVMALSGSTVDWAETTRHYASTMEGVCALDVSSKPLPRARVLTVGPVAFIRPGTGELRIPRHARAAIIDLRGLPAAPGLEEALARAIGALSTTPVERLSGIVRSYVGMMDETTYLNVYGNYIDLVTHAPHAATGQAQLPVALLTEPALAPATARFAADLRMTRRAWLIGAPIHAAVAESRWMPVSTRGLLVRTTRLEDAQGPIPEVIPADLSLATLGLSALGTEALPSEQSLQLTSWLGEPPAVDRTAPVVRNAPPERIPLEAIPPIDASSAIARANLLILHGATRLFYPYFDVVGDGIDGRLMETLAQVDATPVTEREPIRRLLLRFNEVLKDGHGFVTLYGAPPPAGFFPVALEEVQGQPIIRRSALPALQPGDTLVSINGQPMSAWLAEEMAHASAATPGYLHDVAIRRLLIMNAALDVGLRGADGTPRVVQVQPQPVELLNQVSGPDSLRTAGSLADLGAPELHYLNMASEVLTSPDAFRAALTAAQGASGLVVDMRGYPGISHYEVAQRLISAPFRSPVFRYPVWTGPDDFQTVDTGHTRQPLTSPSYAGPIVLLVGPRTVSAAENFGIMLTGAQRVTVIGRRSAGTNGNVTRLLLPGQLAVSFTGMGILFPDQSRFHGVGIVPHIEVAPTVQDIATGTDPELLRAIQFLRTGQ
ncbi:S41 family peptidase [Myxococcus sp. K38C18041901]|uniref:S41 family peptidase n=1 Tax=Myxococcus guangdongensis TaxID=2906760 RepID=UPI0020A7299A|nr:S41 family peptidase [Myxococcus guangdongensis]MCP3057435.1 S41 family peptidase [Myxococcus guangdongensis]